MLPWRIVSIGFALVLLAGCGNKGDLFLVPTEVSEEELESIDEAIDAIDQDDDQGDDQSENDSDNKKKNKEN